MRALFTVALLCAGCLAFCQTVRLQPKFPLGRTDRTTSVTHMVQSFSSPGASSPMQMVMDQSATVLMKVVTSNAQGATLKLTYEGLTSTMSMNGSKTDQSSTLAKSVKGKSVNLMFGTDGNLKKVSGFDQLMGGSNVDAQTKAMMQQLFSEDAIRQMWSMNFGGVIPNKPVKVGDTWITSLSMGQAPMKMNIKLKMKLNKVAGSLALISLNGTGSLDVSGLAGTNMTMKTKSLNVTGSLSFDTVRGWMKEQTMNMVMSATMVMTVQGKTTETPIHSTITTKTTVKPVS